MSLVTPRISPRASRPRKGEVRRPGSPAPPPLPAGLPAPLDDGLASHLAGLRIPELVLPATLGGDTDLAHLAAGKLVLYVYPKTGRPDVPDPPGWDEIAGARGCTQQSCAFRDLQHEFRDRGYLVAGLSAQPTEEQLEAAERLRLNFPLLADPTRRVGAALGLPVFEVAGMILYKRLTLVAHARHIVKVFYPVFPPDENADEVLRWIGVKAV